MSLVGTVLAFQFRMILAGESSNKLDFLKDFSRKFAVILVKSMPTVAPRREYPEIERKQAEEYWNRHGEKANSAYSEEFED